MTVLTEAARPGEAIITEAENYRSRDAITIMASQTLRANQIIGSTAVAATVASAAAAGNTGNGVLTVADPAFGGTVRPGVYRALFIEPAANGGAFAVEDPDGVTVGRGVVGTAFDGPVKFTIADGSTDFVAGDSFLLTVTAVGFRWGAYDPAATDGRAVPRAMLFDAVTTASGVTAPAVALTRAVALNSQKLQWLSGLNATQIAVATALLNANPVGITVR